MKAAVLGNLLHLPMIFHGPEARATGCPGVTTSQIRHPHSENLSSAICNLQSAISSSQPLFDLISHKYRVTLRSLHH